MTACQMPNSASLSVQVSFKNKSERSEQALFRGCSEHAACSICSGSAQKFRRKTPYNDDLIGEQYFASWAIRYKKLDSLSSPLRQLNLTNMIVRKKAT